MVVVLCVAVLGCAVARVAHLRAVHITPPPNLGCGGELIPCGATLGATGRTHVRDARPAGYDPCWELEQAPKHSRNSYENAELSILRKLDVAQCSIVRTVRTMIPGESRR